MLLRYCELFRVVWLAGRYGGGKTSLAVYLAGQLERSGAVRCLAANFALKGPWREVGVYDGFDDLIEDREGCAVVFDEAWSELGIGATPQAVKKYLAFLRKRQSVLLMPSVIPLARTVRVLQVTRLFNGFSLGLPVWLYRYVVDVGSRKPERSNFWWWYPQRVWGEYDSKEVPGDTWRVYERSGGIAIA